MLRAIFRPSPDMVGTEHRTAFDVFGDPLARGALGGGVRSRNPQGKTRDFTYQYRGHLPPGDACPLGWAGCLRKMGAHAQESAGHSRGIPASDLPATAPFRRIDRDRGSHLGARSIPFHAGPARRSSGRRHASGRLRLPASADEDETAAQARLADAQSRTRSRGGLPGSRGSLAG